MRTSWRIGFSFGLSSGIITTLGLMVGLHSGTGSKIIVIGGILTIAIADAFSEAMSIHISQEFENHHSYAEIWESTVSTFFCKFIFSSMFIIPVILFKLRQAIFISILIGLYLIFMISLVIARERKEVAWRVVAEHLSITIIVIVLTHFVGRLISNLCV